jgi:hypothetical protein
VTRRGSLLKTGRKDLVKGILRLERPLDGQRAKLDEIDADRLRLKPPREAKLRRTARRHPLARLKAKLVHVEQRMAANVLGTCVGTRRLFRQQHHLDVAGFDSVMHGCMTGA